MENLIKKDMSEVNYRMFSLSRALKIATCILRNIYPSCEVANIAGSIRRLKHDVKDIEIVCVPKRIKVGAVDLFGEDDRKEIISPLCPLSNRTCSRKCAPGSPLTRATESISSSTNLISAVLVKQSLKLSIDSFCQRIILVFSVPDNLGSGHQFRINRHI